MSADPLNPWAAPSPIARQVKAAELWLELTGRKQANAGEHAREVMAKVAEGYAEPVPAPVDHRIRNKLIAAGALGAGLGAGVAGLAMHRTNEAHLATLPSAVANRLRARFAQTAVRGRAALGGGVAGAGAGLAIGGAHELNHQLDEAQKQAGLHESAVRLFTDRPLARAGVGAAALGLPVGALTGGLALRGNSPGPTGESREHARTSVALALHRAGMEGHGAPGVGDRLREKYLELRDQAAGTARDHPYLAAGLGAGFGAGTGALAGAGLGSKLLR